MSFRARIAVASAAAVALAVVLASALVYVVAREQLRAPIDDALKRRAVEVTRRPLGVFDDPSGKTFLALRPEFGDVGGYVQLVQNDGTTLLPPLQRVVLPVDDAVLAVAREGHAAFWYDAEVDGTHLRVFTFGYGPEAAVQVARPLTEVDQSLDRIGLYLLAIAAMR